MWAAPVEFDLPRFVEGGWIIGGFEYHENPRYTVPGWARRLVHRWAESRRWGQGLSGQAGAAPLPLAGGYLDQPALVMDAFGMFDRWMNERRDGSGSGR